MSIADMTEMHNLLDETADCFDDLMKQLFDEVLCSIDYANGRRQKPAPAARRWVPTHNCGV